MTDPNVYQQGYPPVYQQTVVAPPAPLTELTGGMKAAWFFIGFMSGLVGLLIAYATSRGKYDKVQSDTVKFAAIGWGVQWAVSILTMCLMWFAFAAVFSQMMNLLQTTPYLN
ncbi:MAG: hypothetical protein FWC59_01270 [Actinomycetia bacterium]|nr:hypothetical protein [Actinomycetes bacterium]